MNLIVAALAALVIQSAGASIEGVVRDAQSQQPIPRAQVSVIEVRSILRTWLQRPMVNPRVLQTVTTNEDGRFQIESLPRGSYRMAASHERYARRELGSSLAGSSGEETGVILDLSSGGPVRDVLFELTPSGSIAGRVVSSTGDALLGIQVVLVRTGYDESGIEREFAEASSWTNDRGEYRLSGISTGRYRLFARPPITTIPTTIAARPGPDRGVTETSPGRFETIYYPGYTDPQKAALVEVEPGGALGNYNFVLPRKRGYRIRGRVLDEHTGRSPSGVGFTVIPRMPAGVSPSGLLVTFNRRAYNSTDGTFDVDVSIGSNWEGLAPGSYWLVATTIEPLEGLTDRRATRVAIDIADSDIEDLVIVLRKPVALLGKVLLEGAELSSVAYKDIHILLAAPVGVPWIPRSSVGIMRSQHTPLASDGAFQYKMLMPDTYRVLITGLPDGTYVREARFGDVDVLSNPMTVSGASPATLNILIAPGSARIDGVLFGENAQPLAYREVVLVPDGKPTRIDLYQRTATDASGRFSFKSVPPVNYKLFSWEQAEPFAYFDPKFMERYESHGHAVLLTESATEQVALQVIK